ncbi:hypothetical protein BGX38DRAFT_576197 [Terfezia claveryi]|nr:hypothetical protein BGX38DRAFT_576197 [Terfezia claveryi]
MDWNATQFLSDLNLDILPPSSLFHKCWRLNTCDSCLDKHPTFNCGWCPYSNTCLPAPPSSPPFTIPGSVPSPTNAGNSAHEPSGATCPHATSSVLSLPS